MNCTSVRGKAPFLSPAKLVLPKTYHVELFYSEIGKEKWI